jgi:hypothetical protein
MTIIDIVYQILLWCFVLVFNPFFRHKYLSVVTISQIVLMLQSKWYSISSCFLNHHTHCHLVFSTLVMCSRYLLVQITCSWEKSYGCVGIPNSGILRMLSKTGNFLITNSNPRDMQMVFIRLGCTLHCFVHNNNAFTYCWPCGYPECHIVSTYREHGAPCPEQSCIQFMCVASDRSLM